MKAMNTLLVVTLCTTFAAAAAAGGVDGALTPDFSPSQESVIDRKARKYGLNPNLITAALAVEDARGETDLLRDPDVFEWAAENCGRRLTVAATRSKRVRTVFYIYAVLGKDDDDLTVKEQAKRFARRAERAFEKLEEEAPWGQANKAESSKDDSQKGLRWPWE